MIQLRENIHVFQKLSKRIYKLLYFFQLLDSRDQYFASQ